MSTFASGNPSVTTDEAKQAVKGQIPLKRNVTPEEVGKLMMFLAIDESRFGAGSVYMVDGRISAGSP